MITSFEPYPFEKLRALFAGSKIATGLEPIAFTIGEPQFETPAFIQEELKNKKKKATDEVAPTEEE